jgi:tRNA-dihydrouridine synthase B
MFKLMLAPMENFTDSAFRTLCYNHGADLTFTEIAKVDGLADKNELTWNKLSWSDSTPTQIQLLAGNENKLEKFLKMFKPQDGFSGFNLNLGCPDPAIVKSGRGCGMVKRISKTSRLVKVIQKHNYPVSIKMRLGANNFEKSVKVYMNLINGTNPDFFIIHARSGEDTYNDKADYSVFKECVSSGKIIIANGDIDSVEKVNELRKDGVKGVMIGREAVRNPCIFDEIKGNKIVSLEELKEEYLLLATKYSTSERDKKNILNRIGRH